MWWLGGRARLINISSGVGGVEASGASELDLYLESLALLLATERYDPRHGQRPKGMAPSVCPNDACDGALNLDLEAGTK